MPADEYLDDSERDTVFVAAGAGAPYKPSDCLSVADMVKHAVDPLIGTVIDQKYQILERIGKGGMSVVYRALQVAMGREVAVKTLQMGLSTDPVLVQRFMREVSLLGKLNHPNIVTVFDSGTSSQGQLYLVMDLLSGPTLQDVLRKYGNLKLERAQHIFMQIADALNHAHKRGIIHRDLKPGNILLQKDDKGADIVKVVDFGLAKLGESNERLTQAGEIWGSAFYMSPEQCSAQEVDVRSDIYSLGVVMYETLTGRVPFQGRSFMETIGMQINDRPPPFSVVAPGLQIHDLVERAILRCLEKDPNQRFQTVADLKTTLLAVFPATTITSQGRAFSHAELESAKGKKTSKKEEVRNPKKGINPSPLVLLGLILLAAVVTLILVARPKIEIGKPEVPNANYRSIDKQEMKTPLSGNRPVRGEGSKSILDQSSEAEHKTQGNPITEASKQRSASKNSFESRRPFLKPIQMPQNIGQSLKVRRRAYSSRGASLDSEDSEFIEKRSNQDWYDIDKR
ncbi:MAG TPA: serine/threonine-protein kinase [Candidatus Obscuribacterales bacterium]